MVGGSSSKAMKQGHEASSKVIKQGKGFMADRAMKHQARSALKQARTSNLWARDVTAHQSSALE
jgi:hypothetical protein